MTSLMSFNVYEGNFTFIFMNAKSGGSPEGEQLLRYSEVLCSNRQMPMAASTLISECLEAMPKALQI